MNISYQFASHCDGPRILILWSIHGDERCGSLAIERFRAEMASGKIELLKGNVTAVPYANHAAYLANKRFLKKNLNRIFGEVGTERENLPAEYIKKQIQEHDFVLDLHSFASGKDPFAFNDFDTPEVNAVIRTLPVRYVMTGWVSLYEKSPDLDTIGYAKSQNRTGVTVECWQHMDEQVPEIAYQCILSVLCHFGIIDTPPTDIPQSWIQVGRFVAKPEHGEFVRPWQNFDPVVAGAVIGTAPNGTSYAASETGCIIMPNSQALVGTEWFYLGKPYPSPSTL